MTSLDELLDTAWDLAIEAGRFRDNVMSNCAFVTAGPDVRIVSLREARRSERALFFHGDVRAKKVAQLRANPASIWHVWDRTNARQLHFIGPTTVHTDDQIAHHFWETESPDELIFYCKTDPPGTRATEPTSGIDFDSFSDADARQNFAVFQTRVDEILYHQLHPEGEIRARFFFDGAQFHGHWLIP